MTGIYTTAAENVPARRRPRTLRWPRVGANVNGSVCTGGGGGGVRLLAKEKVCASTRVMCARARVCVCCWEYVWSCVCTREESRIDGLRGSPTLRTTLNRTPPDRDSVHPPQDDEIIVFCCYYWRTDFIVNIFIYYTYSYINIHFFFFFWNEFHFLSN